MKHIHVHTQMSRLAAVLLGLMLVASPALGQVTDDRPIKGTIKVEKGTRDLASLAKITPEQACTAALAAVPGATFDEVELEREAGYLVYEVELQVQDGEVEVLIDAGDGSVLRIEQEDEEDDDGARDGGRAPHKE